MRLFFLIFGGMMIGFLLGWLSRGLMEGERPSPGQGISPLVQQPSSPPSPLSQTPSPAALDPFRLALAQVAVLIDQEQFAEAYDVLLDAVSLAVESSDEDLFIRTLANLVDVYTRDLIALKQIERIDAFYEQLTFDYPQYAEYQFRLGKIRVQMGNHQEALLPLAQVINHPHFGPEARKLIDQIETSAADLAFMEVPLKGRDGQFIVEAELDDGIRVNLLVDTGAAITAIDRAVLQQAGYNMNAEQQYFATANGVVAAPVVTIDALRLGDAGVVNLSVGALSLNMSGGVVGLLGMNFLRHYEFRIDQTRRVLILDKR